MSSPSSSNIIRSVKIFSLDGLTAWVQRYRLSGTVLLFLLGLNLVFSAAFVTPAYRHKMASEASLQSARAKVSQLLQYQKAQEAVLNLEKAFVTQQQLAELADRLPAMARRHQLALPGVSYQTGKQKAGELRKILLSFKVSGRYPNIRKFIYELEGLDQFLYIQGMALISFEKEPNRLDLEMGVVTVMGYES